MAGVRIAVSPIAENPSRTLFHELGHQLLGHCDESDLTDTEVTPRDIREMEAEAVALLCCESLGLEGAEFSRGYIQSWGQGQTFTERSAQRIFHAADQILKAGYSHDSTHRGPMRASVRFPLPFVLSGRNMRASARSFREHRQEPRHRARDRRLRLATIANGARR